MPSKTEITDDKVTVRKFDKSDWQYLSEHILEIYKDRKKKREDLEKQWKDIDRQLEMRPDTAFKLDASGQPDKMKAWMPEVELPLQSQTLEITTADARRMQFPDSGSWFKANSAMTDDYLKRVDFKSIITGDLMEVPSRITQDNADKLVQGTLEHYHRQYDFRAHMDLINAEAIKYSMGVGRAKIIETKATLHTHKGVVKRDQRIPVLFPRSIKNVYLDDNPHNLMNEGIFIGPSIIECKEQAWADLVLAASKGVNDPEKPNGGWMPKNLHNIQKDKYGNVKLIELEGDILVPRKTVDSIYVPNVIVTVCIGDKEASMNVVRLRYNPYPNSSFLLFPYHCEHIDNPYGTSPLMKGRPIQKAAVEALTRLLMVSALHSLPPVSRPSDDTYFNQKGGAPIFPGADWPTTGDVKTHMIGDPSAMMNIYVNLLQQYSDVTGVNAPRLGAQTVSHTTAYAKEAELSRGTIRTVDYVKSTLSGGLEKWLDLEFRMAKDVIKKMPIFLEPYGGYVDVDKASLPDEVVFQVYGSGGPAEEQVKRSERLQAIQLVISLQQARLQVEQSGMQTNIDFDKIETMILREGGITDLEAVLRDEGAMTGSKRIANLGVPGPEPAPGAAINAFGGAI